MDSLEPKEPQAGSAREVLLAFLRLGVTSFGGPVARLLAQRVCAAPAMAERACLRRSRRAVSVPAGAGEQSGGILDNVCPAAALAGRTDRADRCRRSSRADPVPRRARSSGGGGSAFAGIPPRRTCGTHAFPCCCWSACRCCSASCQRRVWRFLRPSRRSGALVFGGGHVVLPLLRAAFVPPGWGCERRGVSRRFRGSTGRAGANLQLRRLPRGYRP